MPLESRLTTANNRLASETPDSWANFKPRYRRGRKALSAWHKSNRKPCSVCLRTHLYAQQILICPTIVVVIDGWGIPTENSPKDGDAIAAAKTPVMDEFSKEGSSIAQGYTELEASSLAVGLPEGLMGNSEVGHLNIGAGRTVWQDVSMSTAAWSTTQ